MKKEYIDIKKILQKPIFNSGETANIYIDGDYIIKIYNQFYLVISKLNNIDIEEKILSARKIETIPEIEVPVSALYDINTKQFIGIKSSYIKGITYDDFIKENREYESIIKDYDYFEDIFKRAEKESIVFPDFANSKNIMVSKDRNNNKTIKLIDYDSIQIGKFSSMTHATALDPTINNSALMLKKEIDSKYLIFTPKYRKGDLFTQELNIYSEYVLFFLDLLNINISQIEQAAPLLNGILTFDMFFQIIGLDDYDIQNKIWKLFRQNQKNEYLGNDKYTILEKYDIKQAGMYNKLVRKR